MSNGGWNLIFSAMTAKLSLAFRVVSIYVFPNSDCRLFQIQPLTDLCSIIESPIGFFHHCHLLYRIWCVCCSPLSLCTYKRIPKKFIDLNAIIENLYFVFCDPTKKRNLVRIKFRTLHRWEVSIFGLSVFFHIFVFNFVFELSPYYKHLKLMSVGILG